MLAQFTSLGGTWKLLHPARVPLAQPPLRACEADRRADWQAIVRGQCCPQPDLRADAGDGTRMRASCRALTSFPTTSTKTLVPSTACLSQLTRTRPATD